MSETATKTKPSGRLSRTQFGQLLDRVRAIADELKSQPLKVRLAERLASELGFPVARSALDGALDAAGLNWRRNPPTPKAAPSQLDHRFAALNSDLLHLRERVLQLEQKVFEPAGQLFPTPV